MMLVDAEGSMLLDGACLVGQFICDGSILTDFVLELERKFPLLQLLPFNILIFTSLRGIKGKFLSPCISNTQK